MRVKIGNVWYDSSEIPIAVQMTAAERKLFFDMSPETSPMGVIGISPMKGDWTDEKMRAWLTDQENWPDFFAHLHCGRRNVIEFGVQINPWDSSESET